MQFWLGVEDFAKIESAKICIDRYTLLVGQNNSGKTFLMQLAYAIPGKIVDLMDEDMMKILFVRKEEAYDEYMISDENISLTVEYLNKRLHEEKENIIKEVFGKDIPIGKLYVDIVMEKDVLYRIAIVNMTKDYKDIEEILDKFSFLGLKKDAEEFKVKKVGLVKQINQREEEQVMSSCSFSYLESESKTSLFQRSFQSIINDRNLFLPASRSGLLLLYRDFFVNRADNAVSYKVEGNQMSMRNENYGGLTKPVYEFLRFLQTYSEYESLRKELKDELHFFEDKLIEGHISVDKQQSFLYCSKEDGNMIPMYLASSMINEMAPMAMAVLSENFYNRVIIDEAEASLHPEKQMELVRFLNRMNNKGMKLIISTHSDTFVSKMNNLYILSQYVNRTADTSVLKQFGLETDDLIRPEMMHVYEFVIQPNGKSIVKEIEGNEKTGYQFDLFTGSAMQLYGEALKLGEMQ